jgi:hypothetical protein
MRLFPFIYFHHSFQHTRSCACGRHAGFEIRPAASRNLSRGDAHSVRIAVGDQTIRTYPVDQVSFVSFGSSSSQVSNAAPKATSASSDLPAGTTVVVRLIDAIDSQRDEVGQVYRASLDQPLAINTAVVASRGSDAVLQLVNAQQAGYMTGRTELSVTLKSVTIRNHIYPVKAEAVLKASSSQARRSAGMIGAGTGIGAIAGAIAGGGRGAAIGAGSGAAGGALAQVLQFFCVDLTCAFPQKPACNSTSWNPLPWTWLHGLFRCDCVMGPSWLAFPQATPIRICSDKGPGVLGPKGPSAAPAAPFTSEDRHRGGA